MLSSYAADPVPSPNTTAAAYPLSVCVVSGDKLGVMGSSSIIQYQGTEVRFCCKDCVKDFEKDPTKYLKRLHEASSAAVAKSTPILK